MAATSFSATEFQSIPLDFILSAPLTAVVNAQKIAAAATRDFVSTFANQQVSFTFKNTTDSTTQDVTLNVPLLSVVPVPHIQIDSLTVHFLYQITQTAKDDTEKAADASLKASTGAVLSPWVSASLQGNVSTKSSSETTMNRSGSLEITMHASEAPIPEGLSRILSLLANTVQVPSAGKPTLPTGPTK